MASKLSRPLSEREILCKLESCDKNCPFPLQQQRVNLKTQTHWAAHFKKAKLSVQWQAPNEYRKNSKLFMIAQNFFDVTCRFADSAQSLRRRRRLCQRIFFMPVKLLICFNMVTNVTSLPCDSL